MRVRRFWLAAGAAATLSLASGWPPAKARSHATEKSPRAKAAKTGLRFDVTPADVQVFIDGEEHGTAGELDFVRTRPGTYNVRLVRGGDEFEADIPVEKGQVVEVQYSFE